MVSALVLNVFTASIDLNQAHASASGHAHGGSPHAKEGDRIRFSVSGIGVASDLMTLTGVDPIVIFSDNGPSRSASRSKSHKRNADKLTAPPEHLRGEPAQPAGEREPSSTVAKRKKHSRTST